MTRLTLAAALLVALAAPALAQQVPDADKQKIADASPAEPVVKPAKDRKILVFSRTTGFRHRSIPWGVEALQAIAKKSGAYTMDATEDPAVFTEDNLKQYDAIVFLNTTGDPVPDPAGRAAIENFVKSGKGLVGIHSATDTGYNWPAYGEMMGGYFDGHPWNAGHTVTMKIEDPGHPINKAAYDSPTVTHKDEIYQHKDEPYSRQKLRILISLDLEGPNMRPGGMKRKDNDYAVAWIREYGEGRVYFNNLGHNEATYWSEPTLKHFLAGIQYATGDLKADATPSAKLAKPEAPAAPAAQ